MMLSLYSAMTFPHTTLSLALTAFFVLIISFQSEIGESIAVAYIPSTQQDRTTLSNCHLLN